MGNSIPIDFILKKREYEGGKKKGTKKGRTFTYILLVYMHATFPHASNMKEETDAK